MSVSVVILSHNRPSRLRQALDSVARQTSPVTETIVVDNRSATSDEIARIVSCYAGVRLVANDRNAGFTGGMNMGLRLASSEHVLLTEDDMVLEPGCVEAFLAFSRRAASRTLSSGLILRDDTGIVHFAGGDVRLDEAYRLAIRGAGCERGSLRQHEPYEVTYLTGALLFARTDSLRKLGGFRDDFFMYMEDVELCLRAARFGYRMVLVPSAIARHASPPAESDRQGADIEFHKVKNLVAVYVLHARARVLPGFLIRYACVDMVRRRFRDPGQYRAAARAWRHSMRRLPALWRERGEMLRAAREA
ncbi:MAG: glycosyltransferase family 2 protein [Vicinamibacterales bacterium]